jgi:hypothetical protein
MSAAQRCCSHEWVASVNSVLCQVISSLQPLADTTRHVGRILLGMWGMENWIGSFLHSSVRVSTHSTTQHRHMLPATPYSNIVLLCTAPDSCWHSNSTCLAVPNTSASTAKSSAYSNMLPLQHCSRPGRMCPSPPRCWEAISQMAATTRP